MPSPPGESNTNVAITVAPIVPGPTDASAGAGGESTKATESNGTPPQPPSAGEGPAKEKHAGSPLASSSEGTPQGQGQGNEATGQQTEAQLRQQASAGPQPDAQRQQQQQLDGKTKGTGGIVAFVVLLALGVAGGAAYAYHKRKQATVRANFLTDLSTSNKAATLRRRPSALTADNASTPADADVPPPLPRKEGDATPPLPQNEGGSTATLRRRPTSHDDGEVQVDDYMSPDPLQQAAYDALAEVASSTAGHGTMVIRQRSSMASSAVLYAVPTDPDFTPAAGSQLYATAAENGGNGVYGDGGGSHDGTPRSLHIAEGSVVYAVPSETDVNMAGLYVDDGFYGEGNSPFDEHESVL